MLTDTTHTPQPDVPADVVASWQSVVDIMAQLIEVPAGLIMRVDGEDIEVLVASQTDGNPYHRGDREHLVGAGLYCERVVNTRRRLCVPDALRDPGWAQNPDVKLSMISYLGFPILLPSGDIFGTLCVLDSKGRSYAALHEELMGKFRGIVERDLSLLYLNRTLNAKNQELERCLAEIKTLQGIMPICMFCKNVRDDAGFWRVVEEYVTTHTGVWFSHSVCPACTAKQSPELQHCM